MGLLKSVHKHVVNLVSVGEKKREQTLALQSSAARAFHLGCYYVVKNTETHLVSNQQKQVPSTTSLIPRGKKLPYLQISTESLPLNNDSADENFFHFNLGF